MAKPTQEIRYPVDFKQIVALFPDGLCVAAAEDGEGFFLLSYADSESSTCVARVATAVEADAIAACVNAVVESRI